MAERRGWQVANHTRRGRIVAAHNKAFPAPPQVPTNSPTGSHPQSLVDLVALTALDPVDGATGPKPLASDHKRQAVILAALRKGMPLEHAAELVGLHRTTIYRAMESCDKFATQVRVAQRCFEDDRLSHILTAERGGDAEQSWRLLRVNPATRTEYGAPQASEGKGGVHVVINVDRAALAGIKQVSEDTITITAGKKEE